MDALSVMRTYKDDPAKGRVILAEELRNIADRIDCGDWKVMELQSMDGAGTRDGDYSILYLKMQRLRGV